MKIYAKSREKSKSNQISEFIGKDIWVRCRRDKCYPEVFFARFLSQYVHSSGVPVVEYQEIDATTIDYLFTHTPDKSRFNSEILTYEFKHPRIRTVNSTTIKVCEPIQMYTGTELNELIEDIL